MIWDFLTSNIAQIGVVVVSVLGAIIYAFRAGRKGGRDAEQNARRKETMERIKRGKKALRDGRASGDDPDDRLRKNDGKW